MDGVLDFKSIRVMGKLKHPRIPGESRLSRRRRLHRAINQKHRLKKYPHRKVGRNRVGPVTKEHILENVRIDPISKCWNWNNGKADFGYGTIRENDRIVRVHRRAYELWIGPIPKGILACHKCDNPACCNPDHIFLGTDLDNMTDACEKGRFPLGESRPNSKLTSEQVLKIRKSSGKQSEMAISYGVSAGTINRVVHGRTYRSIK